LARRFWSKFLNSDLFKEDILLSLREKKNPF